MPKHSKAKTPNAPMWLAKLLALKRGENAWHLARLLTASLNKKGRRALKPKYNALFKKGSFNPCVPKQFRHDVVFLLHDHGVRVETIARNMALDLERYGARKGRALQQVGTCACTRQREREQLHAHLLSVLQAQAEVNGVLFPEQQLAQLAAAPAEPGALDADHAGAPVPAMEQPSLLAAAPAEPGAPDADDEPGSVASPELDDAVPAAQQAPVAPGVCTVSRLPACTHLLPPAQWPRSELCVHMPQYPNTQCHGNRDNLAKFTDDKIKRMLAPNWASATPEDNVLDARFVNMEVNALVVVRACARTRACYDRAPVCASVHAPACMRAHTGIW